MTTHTHHRPYVFFAASAALIVAMLGQSATAAERKPAKQTDNSNMEIPVDDRIKVLTYSINDVYLINTKFGYQTSISFAPNEQITTISIGDRSLWQIIPSGNRLFIRPMNENLSTNMTVITNMREYNFDLKSIAENKTNNIYVAQFRYPNLKNTQLFDDAPLAEAISAEEETMKTTPKPIITEMPAPAKEAPAVIAPTTQTRYDNSVVIPPLDTQRTENLNAKYTFSGADKNIPYKVYDDGKNTYLVFDTIPKPTPVLYLMTPKGLEIEAKQLVSNNTIVLNNVAPMWVMRSNFGTTRIYNESLNPQ